MRRKNDIPRLELATEKLFNRIGLSIVRLTKHLTHIPEGKQRREIYLVELIFAFITLDLSLLAIILIIVRR